MPEFNVQPDIWIYLTAIYLNLTYTQISEFNLHPDVLNSTYTPMS